MTPQERTDAVKYQLYNLMHALKNNLGKQQLDSPFWERIMDISSRYDISNLNDRAAFFKDITIDELVAVNNDMIQLISLKDLMYGDWEKNSNG